MVDILLDSPIEIIGKPVEALTQKEIMENLSTIHKLMIDHLRDLQELRFSKRKVVCSLEVSFYKTTKSGFVITVTAPPNSVISVFELAKKSVIYSQTEKNL